MVGGQWTTLRCSPSAARERLLATVVDVDDNNCRLHCNCKPSSHFGQRAAGEEGLWQKKKNWFRSRRAVKSKCVESCFYWIMTIQHNLNEA
jgi:hypothetical protein